jgi:hypothetical protein
MKPECLMLSPRCGSRMRILAANEDPIVGCLAYISCYNLAFSYMKLSSKVASRRRLAHELCSLVVALPGELLRLN